MSVDLKPFMGLMSLQEIRNIIECPVCIGLSACVTFLQCQNGHIGCQACLSRLTTCPVCRVSLGYKPKIISDEILMKMFSELRHIEKSEIFLQNEKLSQYFQCEDCKFVPTIKPIYLQCTIGHLLCNDCSKPGYCQACKKYLDYPRARSIFSEKILSRMIKPCRFANKGCTTLIEEFSEHEAKECSHRASGDVLVNDVFLRAEIGRLNLPTFLANPDRYNIFEVTKTQCYLKLDNEDYFLMECSISCLNAIFFMRYTGNPKKFAFKLRLFRPGFEKEVSVTGPIVPSDIPECEIPMSRKFYFASTEMRSNWYTKQENISVSWEVSVHKVDQAIEQITFIRNYFSIFRPKLYKSGGFVYVDGY
jgi:hypothetical protein